MDAKIYAVNDGTVDLRALLVSPDQPISPAVHLGGNFGPRRVVGEGRLCSETCWRLRQRATRVREAPTTTCIRPGEFAL
jgi:hypothetical protein